MRGPGGKYTGTVRCCEEEEEEEDAEHKHKPILCAAGQFHEAAGVRVSPAEAVAAVPPVGVLR